MYGSRDSHNRLTQRISKEFPLGFTSLASNYNSSKTACKYKDINYLPQYEG